MTAQQQVTFGLRRQYHEIKCIPQHLGMIIVHDQVDTDEAIWNTKSANEIKKMFLLRR